MSRKIGIVVGSLREASFNRKVAETLIPLFKNSTAEIMEIRDLPLYNEDIDHPGEAPESYEAFRAEIREMDGIVFITPEYNRSIPAAIKNAIDVGSRPWTKNSWAGKPALIISSSPGAYGGINAAQALRPSLACLDMPVMPGPEAFLDRIHEKFDRDGTPKDEKFVERLAELATSFETFVERFAE